MSVFEPSARPNTVSVIYIAATPKKVWAALTEPEQQAAFFGGRTEIGDVGGRFVRHATEKWPEITGEVLVREPPRRLVVTWGFEGDPPPDWVEFLIDPAGETTKVSIHEYHARDWSQDIADSAVAGWASLLSGLKTLVETGRPMPDPFKDA